MRVLELLAIAVVLGAPPTLAGQAAGADTTKDTAAVADTGGLSLVREVFSYQGGGRDPFISLLKSGDVRPLITDLKLVTVVYDGRYPARSVVVLRDITSGKRYRAKMGDVLGRLRVTQIRPRDVVFTVQEFGTERQQTLSLAKQEESP